MRHIKDCTRKKDGYRAIGYFLIFSVNEGDYGKRYNKIIFIKFRSIISPAGVLAVYSLSIVCG